METTVKKKSFARGWSLIPNQWVPWIMMTFAGVSINGYGMVLVETKGMVYANLLYAQTVGGFIGLLVALFGGRLMAKFGAKNVQAVAEIIGGIVFALSFVSKSPAVIMVCICVNLSVCIAYCLGSSPLIVGQWFPRRKGFILGIVTGCTFSASAIFLGVYTRLIASIGLNGAQMIFGFVLAGWGVISLFWVKNTPEECGLQPDNQPITEEFLKSQQELKSRPRWTEGQVWKCPKVWLFSIGWGMAMLCMLGAQSVGIVTMTGKGLEAGQASLVFTICGFIVLIGSVLTGLLDTYVIGNLNTSLLLLIVLVAGTVFLAFTPAGAPVILIALGICLTWGLSGCPNNLFSSQMIDLAGLENQGTLNRVFLVFFSIFKSLGTLFTAMSMSLTGSYNLAFYLFIAMAVCSVIFVRVSGSERLPIEGKIIAEEKKEA